LAGELRFAVTFYAFILDYFLVNVKQNMKLLQQIGEEQKRRLRMILENIARLCKEKGITIAKLERETGLSNGTIARWETASPRVANAQAVADFFGVSLDELVKE
jgi:lambda repressor-like predicted transcriptional regulator